MWNYLGGQAIEANELQFVNNKDKSRTFVTMYMHHNILYLMEETKPGNQPPPGLFTQSMSLKEADGPARHDGVYFNGPTVEPGEKNIRLEGRLGGLALSPESEPGDTGHGPRRREQALPSGRSAKT